MAHGPSNALPPNSTASPAPHQVDIVPNIFHAPEAEILDSTQPPPPETAQIQIRAQFQQMVLGMGQPHNHGNALQQRASQLRQPIMMLHPPAVLPAEAQVRNQLAQALNPFEDPNQVRTQLVQALNLPPPQTTVSMENQVREQIIRVLSQAQHLAHSQNQVIQAMGLQQNQISHQQQMQSQMRTPLLQALNLSQQDVTVANTARLQAMRAALQATMQVPHPVCSSRWQSASDNQPPASFSSPSLHLPVDKDALGSKAATTREDFIFMADCSFRAHIHHDLLNHIRAFLSVREKKRDLSKDERYFVAVAYKDCVRAVRDAWRKIRKAEAEQKDSTKTKASTKYRGELEEQMRVLCSEGLAVSGRLLADSAVGMETRLYFHKVKGDLYRYMAEYSSGAEKSEAAHLGRVSYEEADRIKSCVSAVHPLRLGLALNFGVFLRDACQDSSRGWRVTKVALDEANRSFQMLAELDSSDYRESNGLLMNLRRNLMRWNTAEIDLEGHTNNLAVNMRN